MSREYVCTLTPDLKEKARTELREKEETRSEVVQKFRDMIIKYKAINCPMDDGFLIRFLRPKKFDCERAFKTLENYYKIRAENPQHFHNLKPSDTKKAMDAGISIVLPSKDKHGRPIVYFRPGKWNPSEYSIFEALKMNVLNLEMIVRSEDAQVNGVIFVGNMKDVGWEQAKNLSREYMRLSSSLFQESFPMRLKAFNFVNEPSVFGYVFSLISPFLKMKLKDRMVFHGAHLENLQNEIGIENLPEELGGTLPNGDVLAQDWRRELEEQEDYFNDMLQYKITLDRNLTKASPGTSTEGSSVDAVTGTYKKLNVD